MVTKVKLPSGKLVHVSSPEVKTAIENKQNTCSHPELIQKNRVTDICKVCGKIW